eukprot:TRINITY_DN9269_c0_g1_i1.p1 TRINITY_DN9269_c0_g1~~TRINITY_DN9269_c0_g1_i1.p1  ORF type:complete len:1092 (+),score=420.53 TRINITY_DN9269_c0_g1_i1:49-3324(+)
MAAAAAPDGAEADVAGQDVAADAGDGGEDDCLLSVLQASVVEQVRAELGAAAAAQAESTQAAAAAPAPQTHAPRPRRGSVKVPAAAGPETPPPGPLPTSPETVGLPAPARRVEVLCPAGDSVAASGEEAAHKSYLVHLPPKWQRFHNAASSGAGGQGQRQREAGQIADILWRMHSVGVPAWAAERNVSSQLSEAMEAAAKVRPEAEQSGPLLMRKQASFVQMFDWKGTGESGAGDASPSGRGVKRRRQIAVGRSLRMKELVTMMEEAEEKERARQETARLARIVCEHKHRILNRKEKALAVPEIGSAATPPPAETRLPQSAAVEPPPTRRAYTSLDWSRKQFRRPALELALEATAKPEPSSQRYRQLLLSADEAKSHEDIRRGDALDAARREKTMGKIADREAKTLSNLKRVAEGLAHNEPFAKMNAPVGWIRTRAAGLLTSSLRCGTGDPFLGKSGIRESEAAAIRKEESSVRKQLNGAVVQARQEDAKAYETRRDRTLQKRSHQLRNWAERLLAEDRKEAEHIERIQRQQDAQRQKAREGNLRQRGETYKRLEQIRSAEAEQEKLQQEQWSRKRRMRERKQSDRFEEKWDLYEAHVAEMYHWQVRAAEEHGRKEQRDASRIASVDRSLQARLAGAEDRRLGRYPEAVGSVGARAGGGAVFDAEQAAERKRRQQQLDTRREAVLAAQADTLRATVDKKEEERLQSNKLMDEAIARRTSPRRPTLMRLRTDTDSRQRRAKSNRADAQKRREQEAEQLATHQEERAKRAEATRQKISEAVSARADAVAYAAVLDSGDRAYQESQEKLSRSMQAKEARHVEAAKEHLQGVADAKQVKAATVSLRAEKAEATRHRREVSRLTRLAHKREKYLAIADAQPAEEVVRRREEAKRRRAAESSAKSALAERLQADLERKFKRKIADKHSKFLEWKDAAEAEDGKHSSGNVGRDEERRRIREVQREDAQAAVEAGLLQQEMRQHAAAQMRMDAEQERLAKLALAAKKQEERMDKRDRATLIRTEAAEKKLHSKRLEREKMSAEAASRQARERAAAARDRGMHAAEVCRKAKELGELREYGVFTMDPVPRMSPARSPSRV